MASRTMYKAYSRGKRSRRRYQRYCYTRNPYRHQSAEWHCFNQGWNEGL